MDPLPGQMVENQGPLMRLETAVVSVALETAATQTQQCDPISQPACGQSELTFLQGQEAKL